MFSAVVLELGSLTSSIGTAEYEVTCEIASVWLNQTGGNDSQTLKELKIRLRETERVAEQIRERGALLRAI